MNLIQTNGDNEHLASRYRTYARRAAFASGVILLALVGFLYLPRRQNGPAQPIPFSHRLHVGEKAISCFVCHPDALRTAHAGVPPLETCLLCHKRIIVDFPPIRDLRKHYQENRPIEWVRVNDMPDYVYFNHQVHVGRGIDCGHCHGNVAGMDRIVETPELTMGFCVQCHRDNGVSHDCYQCHR